MATESHNHGRRGATLIARMRVAYMTGWRTGMATGAMAGAVVGGTLIGAVIIGAAHAGAFR